ncbi:hypothetical protein FNV43_RR11166 [Rhamnella rubrinervis]|uniref:Uncharacterized protein n=1 Tax=Rhamnella rubrinervis TaxID=2594499 RepID=A0A8K0MHL6_9ROSA|nr:hypothetical protein FNV43_RR11166 [Rhamnella rubrinervis]
MEITLEVIHIVLLKPILGKMPLTYLINETSISILQSCLGTRGPLFEWWELHEDGGAGKDGDSGGGGGGGGGGG